MTREESIKQIKTLIEAWKLDEADLNQTDINAMQVLLKENQELREALEIKSYCKYTNKCNEIYDCSREEYEDMANANMRLHVENQELKEKLYLCTPEIPQNSHNNYISYVDLINKLYSIEKENEKLKKQLENKYEKVGTLTSELLYEENTKLINQQKEFINYLQKEINQYTTHIEAIDSVCTSIYSSDYDNSKIKLAIYKEILQKYKEIVNGSERN